MRAALALAAVLSAVAVVASGCGGSSNTSPAEDWASSVCTDVNTWVGQVKGAASDVQDQLKSPSIGMAASIQASVQTGVDDTKQLGTTLKALGPPPTTNGTTAKKLVNSLVDDVQSTATKVQQQASTIPNSTNLAETATSIASVAGEISAMVTRSQSTIDSIKELDSELKDAFQNAGSCNDLKKSIG